MIINYKRLLDSPRILFLITSIFIFKSSLFSQQYKADTILLKENLQYLSADSLKGRAPGTKEDSLAAAFISEKLINYGFIPLIGNSLMVPFDFIIRREIIEGSFITVSGKNLVKDKDYFISPVSPSASIEGEVEVIDKNFISSVSKKGKIALIKVEPDSVQFFTTPVSQQGYEGLFFYSDTLINLPKSVRSPGVSIPVVNISREIANYIISQKGIICKIDSRVDVVKGRSFNVLAVKPGPDKKRYILAGAHYDHLGLGGKGSGSMYKNEGEIHNGADDNGSGVVSVIEIGRVLSARIDSNPDSNHSYGVAIAAFGAEERGLIGSRIVADTLTSLNLLPSLMINLDMVGRMNDKRVQAGGAGTFLGADSILASANKEYNLNITVTKDGYGPSDHASF
ncbi:MAG: M28 family peptidase, partial [Bacteroidales bacterium]|nr:M28 family peptidase [Bacteroidales bacterium]